MWTCTGCDFSFWGNFSFRVYGWLIRDWVYGKYTDMFVMFLNYTADLFSNERGPGWTLHPRVFFSSPTSTYSFLPIKHCLVYLLNYYFPWQIDYSYCGFKSWSKTFYSWNVSYVFFFFTKKTPKKENKLIMSQPIHYHLQVWLQSIVGYLPAYTYTFI